MAFTFLDSSLMMLLLWSIQLLKIVTGYGSMSTISTLDGDRFDLGTPIPNTYTVCVLEAATRTPVCEGTIPFPTPVTNNSLLAMSSGSGFLCGIDYHYRTPVCWGKLYMSSEEMYQRYSEISLGSYHVCALMNDSGALDCWGHSYNQTQVPISEHFISLTSGWNFTCGLNSSHKAMCWGTVADPPAETFDAIFAGDSHVCGILSTSNKTLCWGGLNTYNELNSPGNVAFSFIAAGRYHSCGLQSDTHQAVCWGDNSFQQLDAPRGVSFSVLSASQYYTCGVKFDRTPQCWGNGINYTGNGLKVALPQCPASNDNVCHCFENGTCPSVSVGAAVKKRSSLPTIVVAIAGVGVPAVLGFALAICLWFCRKRKRRRRNLCSDEKDSFEWEWEPPACRLTVYTASELQVATEGYSDKMVIGKGAHGTVYKGILSNGQVVAIKKAQSLTGKYSSFDNELQLLARLHHTCLANLLGYCKEQMLVVYEFMENGSLYDCLFKRHQVKLDWAARLRIATQAARGLEYLHAYASPPIIHRDVKSSNILLDRDWNAHISDFGVSRPGPPPSCTHLSNITVVGTPGYLDPEYFQTLQLTTKSDVYSFGVVLMELVSGRKAIDEKHAFVGMVSWISELVEQEAFDQALDITLAAPNLVFRVLNLALRCTSSRGKDRPTMAEVASSLEEIGTSSSDVLPSTDSTFEIWQAI